MVALADRSDEASPDWLSTCVAVALEDAALTADDTRVAPGMGNVKQGRATFTGYVADQETGLDYARSRMYSPGLGRFVGRDPIGYVDGCDLYESYYVPNLLDPDGMLTQAECFQACKDKADQERKQASHMCDDKQKALDAAKQAVKDYTREMLEREMGILGIGTGKGLLDRLGGGKGSSTMLAGTAGVAIDAGRSIGGLQDLARKVKAAQDALDACLKAKQDEMTAIDLGELFCMLDCPCSKSK